MNLDARSLLASVGPVALSGAERDLTLQAIIDLDRHFKGAGLTLRVTDDLIAFGGILAQVGKFLPNAFHPHLKPWRAGDALAFVASDEQGPAATVAVRLYRFATTTLADHLATLSLFYANPAEQMERGERLFISGGADEFAMRVDDTAFYYGSLWVRPDRRRHGSQLPQTMLTLGKTIALARWGEHVGFSIVEKRNHTHPGEAVRKRYGLQHALSSIWWHRPRKPKRQDMLLVACEVPYMLDQIRAFVSAEVGQEPIAEPVQAVRATV